MATTENIRPELLELVERPKTSSKGEVVTKSVKGGGEEVVMRPIKAAEVLSHRVRGDRIAVVTTDGQKFDAAIPEKVQKALAAEAAKAAEGAGEKKGG